jgi:hypothetical protein
VAAQTSRAPRNLAPARGQAAGLVAGAVVSAVAYRVLQRLVPPPAARAADQPGGETPRGWRHAFWRQNFAGEQVSLFAGPASVAGLVAGSLVSGRRDVAALALAAGGVGLLDDLAGSGDSRGLKGHLQALVRGEVTTGGIKVAGLTAAAALLALSRRRAPTNATGGILDAAVDAALVAGTANLVNLFDLRPGRATKAVVVMTWLMSLGALPTTAGPVLGALAGTARADLGGRSMLGDCGANAAGAVLAAGFTAVAPRPARLVALASITALTLASEKASFSRVIDRTVWLRRLDRWGRRPGG